MIIHLPRTLRCLATLPLLLAPVAATDLSSQEQELVAFLHGPWTATDVVVGGVAAGLLRGSVFRFDARTIAVTHPNEGLVGQATYEVQHASKNHTIGESTYLYVGLLVITVAGGQRNEAVFAISDDMILLSWADDQMRLLLRRVRAPN